MPKIEKIDLTHLLNKRFTVPTYNQTFKVGDRVTWLVEPKRKGAVAPFMATGKIVRLYVTTFGSRLRKQAAKIETSGKYLEVFKGRKHTTVSVDKLKHL